ncbi:deleted in lung and esophageal cancer protein 1-like [Prionailurus iriomotensis]
MNVSFSLSLELLSYQKLPADQMLPGVDVRRHANGEKEMVFAQNLLLEYADQPAQDAGGAPEGHRGRARAAALHQLGGLRDLLCEPGTGPGGLPHEPEWLGCAYGSWN